MQLAMFVSSGPAGHNHFAIRKILCGYCQKKLVVSITWSRQAQSIKLQNPLEVSEEDLDLLAILA